MDAFEEEDDSEESEMSVADFLENAEKTDYTKTLCANAFTGEVLAYVTPWNSAGYDHAKKHAAKLTWLAPVWLQVRSGTDSDTNEAFVITGQHDIDARWLQDVREAKKSSMSSSSSSLYVVPRVALESNLQCTSTGQDDDCREIAMELNELRKVQGFDGFTLEIPMQMWQTGAVLAALLKHMGSKVVYVLPPLEPDESTGNYMPYSNFFAVFEESVDRFSLMTYDHARGTGTPNAPFPWVKEVVSGLAGLVTARKVRTPVANKLLVGLPMYGWRSDGEAMTGHALKSWLQSSEEQGRGSIVWDERAREHIFHDTHGQTASYPTPAFMCERLQLAQTVGVAGVALWEIGQTLPYLMATL